MTKGRLKHKEMTTEEPPASLRGGEDGEYLDSLEIHKEQKKDELNRTEREDDELEDVKVKDNDDDANDHDGDDSIIQLLGAFRWNLNAVNVSARRLVWISRFVMVAGVLYYCIELYNHGKEAHFAAWFSAGAFCLVGFPISMYGIISHLANYHQPNVQRHVVRILWMVPIYSMESWLCFRFHTYAIYVVALRNCYESYVLYSFWQFLMEVMGGEEKLVLLLKDKSPVCGVHFTPLNRSVRPWLMGHSSSRTSCGVNDSASADSADVAPLVTPTTTKQVQWTSPFLVRCKWGVFQYVLLKIVTAIAAVILEANAMYMQNHFSVRGGYLYLCILTTLSQCWALYCLAFFYYATHKELSSIRPVGKFLSVSALLFFTWWQSVCLSILSQWNLIPNHAMSYGVMAPEEVATAFQNYLVCIEMFVASIVHTFIFPPSDYVSPSAAEEWSGGGSELTVVN